MIALLLSLILLLLLYLTGRIKGRIQVTLAFLCAIVLLPFLLQIVILHFGLIGFWSVVAVLGVLIAFASYGYARRENDASN